MKPARAFLFPVTCAALAATVACAPEDPAAIEPPLPIASPAPPTSGEPSLFATPDGRVLLSWTEERPDGGHALRFAVLRGDDWSEPRTIATGDDWFVNWADFPSLMELPDGTLAAHWLRRRPGGTYAYDVYISQSFDGGESWADPIVPHDDETPTEHGFVSLFPFEGGIGAIWLDGRNMGGHDEHDGGDMTLRFASIDRAGAVLHPAVLDERTCECCQTTAAVTADGPVVAYRGRSADEIRDIQVVRLENGRWSGPTRLHADEWRIPGCPVNGPMAAARDRRVAIAWYTAVNDEPRVSVAFSEDAGRSFASPIRIDDGEPLGRVATILLDDGSAIVSWLEQVGESAEIRARRVTRAGAASPATTIASTAPQRASGFPRMTRTDTHLIFAWTEPGSPRRIHVARSPLPR